MTLFVQLYESNTAAVKSEIGTFFEAFPNGVLWGNTNNGQGYDLVLLGQARRSADSHQRGRDSGEAQPAGVRAGGEVARATSASTRPSTCSRATAAARTDLKEWLKDAPDQPRPQSPPAVPAGLGLNLYESGPTIRRFCATGNLTTSSSARDDRCAARGIQRGLDFRE